ncbi:MAG: carboxylesterase family protein [Saprospiraceae bacterium]
MKIASILIALILPLMAFSQLGNVDTPPLVKTANGLLEGTYDAGIRVFKGVPFAKPPVGNLRWRAPQPAEDWEGVRKADKFGPRAMQRPIFGDMNFHSDGMSEDCLYLNIWTPAEKGDEALPVLVYFYGGGLFTGDGSEPRYWGESMARNGIISITVNYRLNIFGFFAHPELSQEADYKASGNYGFLDQYAALLWVKENIAAFGGDPSKVTIAGESAGSVSVSAQMVSPLSKKLMARAIGSSGSLLGTLGARQLKDEEQKGVDFAKMLDAKSLADLRAIPAETLLEATSKVGLTHFSATVDGYFFPKSPLELFSTGKQARIPLLIGWNSEESNPRSILGEKEPTPENYSNAIKTLYGADAAQALQLYPGTTPEEVLQSATNLAGDRFTGYSSWKWSDAHRKTGLPVFRYYYTKARPAMRAEMGNAVAGLAGGVIAADAKAAEQRKPSIPKGAVHSAEIEYAMGNLPTNKVYDWTADDYKVSSILQGYYLNFVKTGDPNGLGLPKWPAINKSKYPQVMHIGVATQLQPDQTLERYRFLEKFYTEQ